MMWVFNFFILLVAQLVLRTDAIPYRPYFIYKRLTILSKSVLVCVIGYLKVAVWDVCILKNRVCKSAELFVACLQSKWYSK